MTDDDKSLTIHPSAGRDIGKVFFVQEVDPLTCSGLVLRLVSALRIDSFEDMLKEFSDESNKAAGRAPIDAIMRVLRGADPVAVHALITEVVENYVKVTPDPKHPGAVRAVMTGDIRELRTLGEVLVGFAKLHFALG